MQAEEKHQTNETKLLELKAQNDFDEALLRQLGTRDFQEQLEAERTKQDKPFQADISKFKIETVELLGANTMVDENSDDIQQRVDTHNQKADEAEKERASVLGIEQQIADLQQQKTALQEQLEPKIQQCRNEYRELDKFQVPKDP